MRKSSEFTDIKRKKFYLPKDETFSTAVWISCGYVWSQVRSQDSPVRARWASTAEWLGRGQWLAVLMWMSRPLYKGQISPNL